jgi:hypothetical protein
MSCCPSIPLEQIPSATTKAVMCQACPMARRGADGEATHCTKDLRTVLDIARDAQASCPWGRFTARSPRTRWLGAEWWGSPEPLRWVFTWAAGREPRGVDDCGCLVWMKDSRIGGVLAPILEGIVSLRGRFAAALKDWKAIEWQPCKHP